MTPVFAYPGLTHSLKQISLFLIEENIIFSPRRFQILPLGKKALFCVSGKVLIVECMWDASRIWKYPVQPLTCLEIHME